MKKSLVILSTLLMLLFCACQYLNPYVDIVREKGISDEYLAQLQKWTRSEILYSQFETRIHVSATYRNSSFNKAYNDEYDRLYEPSLKKKQQKETIQNELSSEFTEFFVYAYIPEMNANDMDKPSSIWSVYMMTDQGQRISPIEIRRFKIITPVMEAFFPYLNQYYGVSYSVKFPPIASGDTDSIAHFKLFFQSVLGKVELNW